MNKLLVVEDEVITSDLLRRYFEIVGYEVLNALKGKEAIKMAIEHQPKVIILDIMLPDMDGYDVCRRLRSDERTNDIPIIFLTQKDDRRDKLEGLELGADDYITKPFDVEELRLRVHNIIGRVGGTPLVDPRTSLPNMALIKERLPKLLEDPGSAFIDIEIQHYEPFAKQYGPVAANQLVRSAAKIIGDLLHEIDPTKSFIGHPRDDHFLLVVPAKSLDRVKDELPERFAGHVKKFYDIPDQERSVMLTDDGEEVPFMSFKLTTVKADTVQAMMAQEDKPEKPPIVKKRSEPGEDAKPAAEAETEEAKPAEAQAAPGAAQQAKPAAEKSAVPQKEPKPEDKAVGRPAPREVMKKAAPQPARKDVTPPAADDKEKQEEKEKPDPGERVRPNLKIVVDNTKKDQSDDNSNGRSPAAQDDPSKG